MPPKIPHAFSHSTVALYFRFHWYVKYILVLPDFITVSKARINGLFPKVSRLLIAQMGAKYSTNGAAGASRGPSTGGHAESRSCYYELLGVDWQATDDE